MSITITALRWTCDAPGCISIVHLTEENSPYSDFPLGWRYLVITPDAPDKKDTRLDFCSKECEMLFNSNEPETDKS